MTDLEMNYQDDNVVVADYLVVYRYIRPKLNWFLSSVFDDPVIGNENLYGITVRFDVDYLTRIVSATWSICDGDNFSKAVGRSRADLSPVIITFNLEDVDTCAGLVDALVNKLNHMYPKYSCHEYSNITRKIRLFKRAMRD